MQPMSNLRIAVPAGLARGPRLLPTVTLALALALAMGAGAARPAAAQWTPVPGVPALPTYALAARGDTLLAGADSAVYVSLDRGASWSRSATVAGGLAPVVSVWIERGLLWAGTYGQGVWTSADHGVSWQNASAGLVGGIANSQLYVVGFVTRGDSLYAGTAGAGVYVKRLSTDSAWSVFGPSIVSSASGTVNGFAGHGDRILAGASPNGILYYNDRGQPDWTEVVFQEAPLAAGLEALGFAWTGSGWLASTVIGLYRSPDGSADWQRIGPEIHGAVTSRVVSDGGRAFAVFSGISASLYFVSLDQGTTWLPLDDLQPGETIDLRLHGEALFAARADGVWRRAVDAVGVEPTPSPGAGIEFALAGPNPARGRATLRLSLPTAARVRVTAFDVTGRAVGVVADGEYAAGAHVVAWEAAGRAPGVYFLRLDSPGAKALRPLRVVLVR